MSKIRELLIVIEEKSRIEEKSIEAVSKLKMYANNLAPSDLNDCSYEECRELFRQIKYYIDDENIVKALSDKIENKKIEKYPELLRPTYYPEIDSLNISDLEKIRLDKAARWNIRNRMTERNAKKMKYPLSMNDLELLKSIGIVEKFYNFRCKNCGSTCTVILESNLEKYRRFWELFELEKQKKITAEQLNELDQLDEKGFYEIYICCMDGDGCDDVEITNEKELSDYMKNVEVFYKVVKNPDLTYEKL